MASLQERAQSNNEARVREVEAENQQLHQSITDTSSRLASLDTQLKLANEEAARLRERAGRCEEVEREAAKLERSRDALNREVTRHVGNFDWVQAGYESGLNPDSSKFWLVVAVAAEASSSRVCRDIIYSDGRQHLLRLHGARLE